MASIMRKMNVISRCEGLYRAEKSSENLPGIYHSYIISICNNPGITQGGLAEKICVNKSNVTRHLAFLEANGYIKRKVCDFDKREMLVFPTDKMLVAIDEIMAITREWNCKIAEGIPEDELEIFHKTLDKIFEKSKQIIYGKGDSV